MTYTKEEKKRIENLLAAFSEYIDSSECVDVLYSKKFGFLTVYPETKKGDGVFSVVKDFDGLLQWLFREVAFDSILKGVKLEETLVKSREVLEPILNRLGEDKEHCLVAMEHFLTIEE